MTLTIKVIETTLFICFHVMQIDLVLMKVKLMNFVVQILIYRSVRQRQQTVAVLQLKEQ